MSGKNRLMNALIIFVGCAAAAIANLTVATGTTDYTRIPPDMLAGIEVTEAAFMAKDLDAVAKDLAEDYSWYKIDDQGAQQMVSGRAATLELLNQFFSNDGGWAEPEVHRLGYLGNIFVQVEVDHFDTPEGRKTIRSLNIYELKDGKRWREWKFYPNE
jgi:limonene-1,2-epoxide hydrolase